MEFESRGICPVTEEIDAPMTTIFAVIMTTLPSRTRLRIAASKRFGAPIIQMHIEVMVVWDFREETVLVIHWDHLNGEPTMGVVLDLMEPTVDAGRRVDSHVPIKSGFHTNGLVNQ